MAKQITIRSMYVMKCARSDVLLSAPGAFNNSSVAIILTMGRFSKLLSASVCTDVTDWAGGIFSETGE